MMRCDGDMTAVVEEWAVVGTMGRSLAALGMTAKNEHVQPFKCIPYYVGTRIFRSANRNAQRA